MNDKRKYPPSPEMEAIGRLNNRLNEVKLHNKKLQAENERLLNAVKLAYRKHHLDDPSVGWEELSNALFNTLCDAMGDVGFYEWLKNKGCNDE